MPGQESLDHAIHDINNWAHASSCAFCKQIAEQTTVLLKLTSETEGHLEMSAEQQKELESHPALLAVKKTTEEMREVRDLAAAEAGGRARGMPSATEAEEEKDLTLLERVRGREGVIGNGPLHLREMRENIGHIIPRPLQILTGHSRWGSARKKQG